MKSINEWKVHQESGKHRVLVTKMLPGREWLNILLQHDCRVEVRVSKERLSKDLIADQIAGNCQGIIGQLTERWDNELFQVLRDAGGKVYCNYAVGYDNVDVGAASANHILVCNTPGVLTETTAEMAVALTMACARRLVEADAYVRDLQFKGWEPDLLLGVRLNRKKVGIIGAGRIGSHYGISMCRAFLMDLIYFDTQANTQLEKNIQQFNAYLKSSGQQTVLVHRVRHVDELLKEADVISLHTPLVKETRYMIDRERLNLMKQDAILINTSRGPVIDEKALVEHCKMNHAFRAGLDVFENEPEVHEGLMGLPNVVLAPHIASATNWTRENMSKLSALNLVGVMNGYPAWGNKSISDFFKNPPPKAIPGLVNGLQ